MKYLDLKKHLNNFIVFSLSDIRKIETDFDRRRLNEWQNKGYIKMVKEGFYIFSDLEITEGILFFIANRLYNPSYISLETALNYYSLIPEGVYSITSVSTKKTTNFNTQLATFNYRSVKPEFLFGYRLGKIGNHNYKIAEIEKVVLDYLYLNPLMADDNNFAEWRFDFDVFKEKANLKKFATYLSNFDSPSLNIRAKRFIKYMENQNAVT
jgi:predicted transcriptional regulator of viral defense system